MFLSRVTSLSQCHKTHWYSKHFGDGRAVRRWSLPHEAWCPRTLTTCRPCWTNYERMHEESISLSIHNSLVMCFNSYTIWLHHACPSYPLLWAESAFSHQSSRCTPTMPLSRIWKRFHGTFLMCWSALNTPASALTLGLL